MPTYAYVAMNSSGQEVKEEVDANTADEAIAKIRSKGYFPTKVKEKAAKKAKKKAGGGDEAPAAAKKKMPISIGGVPRKQLVASQPRKGDADASPRDSLGDKERIHAVDRRLRDPLTES